MKTWRFGIIGAGGVAVRNHMPNLAKHEDVVLDTVCRKGVDHLIRIRDHFDVPFATEDADEALERDLDAVVVSSPHHLHYQHAKAALQRGMHVFCEKPMTLDAAEAWELESLARVKDLHLLVAHGWNYKRHFPEVRRMLANGAIGKLEAMSCVHAAPIRKVFTASEGRAKWKKDLVPIDMATWQVPENGGGFAHGQLAHAAALFLWLGDLKVGSVQGRRNNANAAVDLYNSANFCFTQGAIGQYFGTAALPDECGFQLEIRFLGEDGVLFLDIERPRLELRRHDGQSTIVDVEPGAWDYSLEGPIDAFMALLRGSGGENLSPPELGARCVELAQALVISDSHGGATVEIGDRGEMAVIGWTRESEGK